jgi:hypothetical protein
MFPQKFRIPWARIEPYVDAAGRLKSHLTSDSFKVIGAIAIATVAALVIVALPDDLDQSSASASSATAAATSATQSADGSCENNTWPYIDHRCAPPAAKNAPPGMRNVRVVSPDRGTSANLVTAVPVVEAKRPAEIPQLQESVAKLAPVTAPAEASVAPQRAELSPVQERVAPEVPVETPVFSEAAAAKAKAQAARAEEKRAEKRVAEKAKRERQVKALPADKTLPADPDASIEQAVPTEMTAAATGSPAPRDRQRKTVPPDVIAAVKAATSDNGYQNAVNRPQEAVPADVVDAVKAMTGGKKATRAYKSKDGRRIVISEKAPQETEEVSVSSPGSGTQRLFLVPREQNQNNWQW